MNKIIVALLAAVMLMAFGYAIHSVNAAGSRGSDTGVASDTDRTAANTSRTDKTDRGKMAEGTSAVPYDRPLTSTSMDRSWADQHHVDKMIGRSVVNAKGDSLGEVKDFIVDDQGRINFAVVSHGGFLGIGATKVLVPYEALSFDGKGHFALNLTKDQLAAAPRFDEHNYSYFSDRSWTDQVYRYYGVQPRWSELPDSGATLNQDRSFQTPSEFDRSTAPDSSRSGMGTPGSGSTGAGSTGSGSTY